WKTGKQEKLANRQTDKKETLSLQATDHKPQTPNHNSTKVIDLETATKIHESLITDSKSQIPDPSEMQGKSDTHPQDHYQLSANSSQLITNDYRLKSTHLFEITTFRSDGVYTDFRRPDSVSWGTSLEEDLKRRDFTINAIA